MKHYKLSVINHTDKDQEVVLFAHLVKKVTESNSDIEIYVENDTYENLKKEWIDLGTVHNFSALVDEYFVHTQDASGMFAGKSNAKEFRSDSFTCVYFTIGANKTVYIEFDFKNSFKIS